MKNIELIYNILIEKRKFIFEKYKEYFDKTDGYCKSGEGHMRLYVIFDKNNYISYEFDNYFEATNYYDIKHISIDGLFGKTLYSLTEIAFQSYTEENLLGIIQDLVKNIKELKDYNIEEKYNFELSIMKDLYQIEQVDNDINRTIYENILYSICMKLDTSLNNFICKDNKEYLSIKNINDIIYEKEKFIQNVFNVIKKYIKDKPTIIQLIKKINNKLSKIKNFNFEINENHSIFNIEIYSYVFVNNRIQNYKGNVLDISKKINNSFLIDWDFTIHNDNY